jgi:hypothetical protein
MLELQAIVLTLRINAIILVSGKWKPTYVEADVIL